jgi:hypothetical protein
MLVLAHSGHWLIQLVYAAPLLFMAGLFAISYFRQRRDGRPPRRRNGPSA